MITAQPVCIVVPLRAVRPNRRLRSRLAVAGALTG